MLSVLGITLVWQDLLVNACASFAFFSLLPFFSRLSGLLPRIAFSIGTALLIDEGTLESNIQSSSISIALALLYAVFWGFLCALPLLLTTELIRAAAQLFDTIRGHNIEGLYSAQSSEQESVLEQLVFWVVTTLLLSSGLLEHSLSQLLSGVPAMDIQSYAQLLFTNFFTLISTLLLYAAPLCVLFVFADFGLGVISRQLPRMMLMSEQYVFKLFLSCFMLLLYLVPNVSDVVVTLYNSLFRIAFLGVH